MLQMIHEYGKKVEKDMIRIGIIFNVSLAEMCRMSHVVKCPYQRHAMRIMPLRLLIYPCLFKQLA